jgi:coenzyme F420-reducing hydrogenase delta subunit
MRVKTVKRLLSEVGLDPARAELMHCPADVTAEQFGAIVREAAHKFTAKTAAATPQES